jgi:3-hydroxyacyl-CoA dehydrogenase/enoyl-CoA hydratase/3-hydroxybutyryl-CoA epimerase
MNQQGLPNENDAAAKGLHGFRAEYDAASRIATIVMQMDGRANKINRAFGEGLAAALEAALAFPDGRGIVIASGHRDWCVGADIDVLFGLRDPAGVRAVIGELNQLYRRIETCRVPVVAALTGSALGGGYELALACHYRIALDSPSVRFGLPEVTLGVIPGAGGTQRLPRLIGLQPALEHILQGRIVRAAQARKAGLVDELAADPASLRAAAETFIAGTPKPKQPFDRRDFRWPGPQPDAPEGRALFGGAAAMLLKQTAGAFPAPEAALRAVYEGTFVGIDAGVAIETRYFVQVITADSAKDMLRTVWYHRTAAEKLEGREASSDPPFRSVAILGAGMMGSGLAAVAALAGCEVVLKDIDQAALDKGLAVCRGVLEKRSKHKTADERAVIAGRVRGTLQAAELEGVDLVIEAVVETKKVKHAVIRETEAVMNPDGVFASNTSALPIGDLAQAAQRPAAFLGLHFFSPVETMPLVEVVRGPATNDRTLARALAFCRAIEKIPIVVNDGFGFYTTRVFARYIMEGAQLVLDGHDPVLVEWAAKSAGMLVPPLKVFDEVSLTLGRHVLDSGREYVGDEPGLEAGELLKTLIDVHGRSGKAAGKGFYDYQAEPRRIWSGLRALARRQPAETGVPYLQRRLLLVQALEAARCLEQGILRGPAEGDLGALLGLGFAPQTGGPFAWLDRQDRPALLAEADRLAAAHGPRFAAPELLRRMAREGGRFYPEP